MKQFILLLIAFLFINVAQAQNSVQDDWLSPFEQRAKEQIQVFPNPAISHFSLTHTEGVSKVIVYNLVGRKMKLFEDISSDTKYYIGDLSKGIYLVQIMDRNNKIITTRRISKK